MPRLWTFLRLAIVLPAVFLWFVYSGFFDLRKHVSSVKTSFQTGASSTIRTVANVIESGTAKANNELHNRAVPSYDIIPRGNATQEKNDESESSNVSAFTESSSISNSSDVYGADESAGGPHGQTMVAMGKLVKPRVNTTVRWSLGNATTPCPSKPLTLHGPLRTYLEAPDFTEIVQLNPGLEEGGHYHPDQCRARHRVAVIVPYRDREQHLRLLLHNLHPMLARQQLDYFILVVELAQPTKFNRAMLMNIGAVEALGLWDVQCFVFHDVDLIPEDDRNLYTCPDMPRHLSAAVDKFKYRLPYQDLMGGVVAIRREQFYGVNGYPNRYFGWGGEDDDFSSRIRGAGLKVDRNPMKIARYKMIRHGKDKKNEANPNRLRQLKNWQKRFMWDGLNSLEYDVKDIQFRNGYTWLLVSVDMYKVMKSFDTNLTRKEQRLQSRNVSSLKFRIRN